MDWKISLTRVLLKSKKIKINNEFEELYAVDAGIIFISKHNYSGIVNFQISEKHRSLVGSGHIYNDGKASINYRERGIILYKNPEATSIVNDDFARIYKIIPDKISIDGIDYPPKTVNNIKEKQHPFLKSTRPWSFQQSIAAILLGTVLAIHINIVYFAFSILAVVLAQGSFNIINGYYDYKSGNDTLTSMTSTRVFIDKIIDKKKALLMALAMLAISGTIGTYLVYSNTLLIIFLLLGIFAGIVYSLPKYGLKRLALGDLSICIIWGPGIMLGSYILQGGIINLPVTLISFSIGILTANIVHGNNWRDMKEDSDNHIKTVSTLLKARGSEIYYLSLLWVPYFLILLAYAISPMYYPVLAAFITLPMAFRISSDVIKQKHLNILDAITAKFTMAFAFSSFIAYAAIYYLTGLLYLRL
ncbi:prenyltransferase [Ferroplasma sp.]|uniref:prenyltransferase n=1 Tax=Ferroplasma sp. TaxID=2591003 RepID=UPI00307E3B4F